MATPTTTEVTMGATFEAITTDDQFLNTGYDMHVTNLHAGQIMRALGYGADLEANDGTPCGAKSLDEFHAKVRKALADWHRPDLHVYLDQLARLCQATAEIDDTARITWA